jgi:hypothetical protein
MYKHRLYKFDTKFGLVPTLTFCHRSRSLIRRHSVGFCRNLLLQSGWPLFHPAKTITGECRGNSRSCQNDSILLLSTTGKIKASFPSGRGMILRPGRAEGTVVNEIYWFLLMTVFRAPKVPFGRCFMTRSNAKNKTGDKTICCEHQTYHLDNIQECIRWDIYQCFK